jgi:hypothetical protein
MVETQDDKEGLLPITIPQGEKVAWDTLGGILDLYNPNRFRRMKSSEFLFTWSNFCKG